MVAAGTVNGNNQKKVSFSIPVKSAMAPNARIVVYYVHTDGEIVTDSISFDVEGVFDNKVFLSFAYPNEAKQIIQNLTFINFSEVQEPKLRKKSK
jgi:hypothetical protein